MWFRGRSGILPENQLRAQRTSKDLLDDLEKRYTGRCCAKPQLSANVSPRHYLPTFSVDGSPGDLSQSIHDCEDSYAADVGLVAAYYTPSNSPAQALALGAGPGAPS